MKKKAIWIGAPLLAAVSLVWGFSRGDGDAGGGYRFVVVERGDVEMVVSSTGSLQATKTVQVGTQVSGQIAELRVDFNDRVASGQLLARIDPVLLEQEVRSAQVGLDRSVAELEQRRRELERTEELYAQKVATESELLQAKYQYSLSKASYESAQISVDRARRNLDYTEIRAPIDGVVVERNVDVGQTVAASLSAPTLFLIAEDLSSMEIRATVDESDIGQIHEGQAVRFTVQAYASQAFDGTVRQVRLQSTSQENVVSYVVVIDVDNADGNLLPGMTATVDFIVASERDVLKVTNTALRLVPTAEMQAALQARRQADGAAMRGAPAGVATRTSTQTRAVSQEGPAPERAVQAAGTGPMSQRAASADRAMLWFIDEDGGINAMPVRKGITDGQYTVIEDTDVREGMQLIAAVTSAASPQAASNPFQVQQQPRGPGGGRGPGM